MEPVKQSAMGAATKQALAEAIDLGFERLEEQDREAISTMKELEEERAAEMEKEWRWAMKQIYKTLPEWLHPFLSHPLRKPKARNTEGDLLTLPAYLNIPQCMSPILVFANFQPEDAAYQVAFYPVRYAIVEDDESEGGLAVLPTAQEKWTKHDILHQCTSDLNVALAQARQSFGQREEMIGELRRRKEQQAQAPKPQKTMIERLQQQMERLYNEQDDGQTMASTYTLALAATSIATSLDDLATTLKKMNR